MTDNIEKEIKLTAEPELQAKLLASVKSKDIDKLKNDLKAVLDIESFEFRDKRNILIEDGYYDSSDMDLKEIGSCIRIRQEDGKRYITIKKEEGVQDVGERSRIETTSEITQSELTGLERSNFGVHIREYFPELLGKEIHKKIELRNNRVSYRLVKDGEIYRLSLDTYKYDFLKTKTQSKTFFEIELEAESQEAKEKLSSLKIQIAQDLSEFSYSQGSKYSRGIELLSKEAENVPGINAQDRTKYALGKVVAILAGIATIIGVVLQYFNG